MGAWAQFDCSWHHLRQIHSITINFLQGVPFFAASNAGGGMPTAARRPRRSVAPAGGFRQNTPSVMPLKFFYCSSGLMSHKKPRLRRFQFEIPTQAVKQLQRRDTSTKLRKLAYQTARLRAPLRNGFKAARFRAATVREPVSELPQPGTSRSLDVNPAVGTERGI